jgi:hypothetical protein
MTIAKRTPIFQCLLLAGVLSFAACGGGGGGKKQPPADTTPNAISLAASTNVEPNTLVTSAPVTISGINTASPVSIVGGEYSISGGAFTANPGSITNGQTLTVRITASDKTNTPKEAVVTVGGVSAKFAVTTAADVTPDAFTFAPKNDAQLNAEYTSDPITVSGIDVAVPVSIAGGLYSINGGDFTAAAGTVSAGQTITVKTTAAAKTETAQEAVITIGGVSGTFSVTTIQDTMPPVAEFKFPTPYTMSEAASVKVRGTATDDNAITNVKVVVRSYKLGAPTVTLSTTEFNATPKSEANGVKDFSSWTVDVPLTALAENEIKVVATDVRNNSIALDAANQVVIRQANVASAFPDEVNEFDSIFQGLAVDTFEGRNRVLIGDTDSVISVDLNTGARLPAIIHDTNINSLVLDPAGKFLFASSYDEILEFDLATGGLNNAYRSELITRPTGMTIDPTAKNGSSLIIVNSVYSDTSGGSSVGFSLSEKKFYLISPATNQPYLMLAEGVAVDKVYNRYLMPVGGQFDLSLHGVVAVDRDTGAHSMFSSNTVGGGEPFGEQYGSDSGLITAVVDEHANALLVPELANKLFSIDLATGNRKVLTNLSYRNTAQSDANLGALEIRKDERVLFVVESNREAILVVDLESGDKVILSKSKNNL